jgi:MYXO-CTERM domain-containing protein/uncharacterized repeat protein (TIGR01451 family)
MNTIISIVGRAVAGALALALVVAPAAGRADSDLSLTVSGPRNESLGTGDPDAGSITIGQTKTFTLTIANAGPSTAATVNVAKPVLDSKLKIVGWKGCALHETDSTLHTIDPTLDAAWPCVISQIQDGTSTKVLIDVTYEAGTLVPADYPKTMPSTCPADDTNTGSAGFGLIDSEFSVSAAAVDPDPANNAVVYPTAVSKIADLSISITRGAFAVGSNVTYTATVTNNGPCLSNDVWIADWDGASTFNPPPPYTKEGTSPAGTLTFVSSSGDAGADCEPIWDNCEFGDMDVGVTMTQDIVYTVNAMPSSDLMQTGYTLNLSALSGDVTYDFGRNFGQTLDPKSSNDRTSVQDIVSKDVSTCATGGVPGLLGLVLVGLLPLARRRRNS